MDISVVVATYNGRSRLQTLLDALFRQEFPADEMEIIVVVDGSTDGTGAMLRGLAAPCAFRCLEQANAGQAAARNAGWRVASGAVVLFLDDDLDCPPGLLAEHLAAHGGGNDRIVVGRIVSNAGERRSLAHDVIADQLVDWARRLDERPEMEWPRDAYVATNCSVPRWLLEEVDGFDPAFFRALEDHDLGLRLWARGGRFVFAPRAVVAQRYAKTTKDAVRDENWYGRAEVLLGRKHPDCLQHTLLARAAALNGWRGQMLRLFARSPAMARLLLGLPVELIERWDATGPLAALGRRLVGAWLQAARMRAGAAACGGWTAFDAIFARGLGVLMYHHVGPPRPGTYASLSVAPEAFERQIAALAERGYRSVTPSEYVRVRRGEADLPTRAVMVTFDDGYADIAVHALPVLARHGFGAVVFIVTGEISGTNAWDEVRGSGTHRLLGREEILKWQNQGVEFGGHSRTHPSLPSVTPAAGQEEIAGCREDLRNLTGTAPLSFAYPYGDYDDRAVAAVRREYALAFSAEEGLNRLGTDALLLRRSMVMPGDSPRLVLLRARLGYSPWDVLMGWRAALLRPVRRLLRMLRIGPPVMR